jgi:hypothetical protein
MCSFKKIAGKVTKFSGILKQRPLKFNLEVNVKIFLNFY